MSLELLSQNKVFGGWHKRYSHQSESTQCTMTFAVYEPPQIEYSSVPVLYWLSGLTCTDENFMQKAGAFKKAAERGLMIVAPDTSPRGEPVPDDPDGAYDLGLGAGFYLNATQPPWADHFRMYDYVAQELPSLIHTNFNVNEKKSISGHSMGGHGALVISLRESGQYQSASAFSPICHPTIVPWGKKAFTAYLGDTDTSSWQQYDASLLMSDAKQGIPTLVDQGLEDAFLEEQLQTKHLQIAGEQSDYPVDIRFHEGYDHSYFFISSFIQEHIDFHAQYLK